MTTGDLHEIAPNLVVIEGHHPHAVWEDPDLASIAVYRGERTLYLLDTGVGPDQRAALLRVADQLGGAEEVLLLNSHGHMDHLGNNDVLAGIPAVRRRHLIPRAARPALDFEAFFGRMYHRGVPYFDYLDGLSIDPAAIASILRAVGADPRLTDADVADLGKRVAELGITPAIGQFIPSLLVDMLVRTYPKLYTSVETMEDYEDLGPAAPVTLGAATWTGWSLNGGEVNVLQSAGHSAGGVVFHIPEHRFLMMADETTSIPIWADSDPRNTVATAHRALAMMDAGDLDVLAAGHRPLLPVRGDEARGVLRGIVGGAAQFTAEVDAALRRHPGGVTIDDLAADLAATTEPGSMVALLLRLQFPVFSTFFKLTLLNHCLLLDLPQGRDAAGRPTFRAST
jgi:glyoxylase-like metal-dependent hydrolase (beta-lactamase superfamily II)